MLELGDLCRAAVEAARPGEAVEAFGQEARHTEVKARRGEVEGLTFSESRGIGVRLIAGGRVGFAWAADPSTDEVAATVARARENAALAEPDEFNALPDAASTEPIPALYRAEQADMALDRKVGLALDLERRATSTDPRVTNCDDVVYGDSVSRVAIASTAGVDAGYERTDTWCVVVALAVEGDETQTGFSYRIGRELGELAWEEVADEAVRRAAAMLGATKPASQKVPVVLDPFAGSSFLGVLGGALSAEAVQKGRSLFAERVGEEVGSAAFTLIDDGRELAGPAAAPFDDEGAPTGRTELITAGTLNGFLHNSYTARRGGTISTGNASRGGYRTSPGVGTTNFYVAPGHLSPAELLAKAEGGVLINDVSGVHSGANPISGTFSVGATGWRIGPGGEVGEPLREMTIGSTIPEMLAAVAAVGNDLRFFSSTGVPTILIGEMTVAGV
ncbi:MAG: TldD/PmbA family protein [Actinobacteria bacterium]|nr:TldD/PmbA family protein [Actinomycetota bacterium]